MYDRLPSACLRLLLPSLVVLALAGCASGESIVGDDPGGGDRPSPGNTPGQLGETCARDADCQSSLCLFDPEFDRSYCSRWCDDGECVESRYACIEIDDGGQPRGACLLEEEPDPVSETDDVGDDVGTDDDVSDSDDDVSSGPPVEPGCPGVCTPGEDETGEEACGDCGEGLRARVRQCTEECIWSPWSAWSECSTSGVCSPGASEEQREDCEGCPGFERVRSRTCDGSSCQWGPWSGWEGCQEAGQVCTPGQEETDTRDCPTCGTESRTRTCLEDGCGFTGWSSWSGCDGGGDVCTPGQEETDSEPCGACGEGTRVRTRTCNLDGCGFSQWSEWGDCQTDAQCSPGQTDSATEDCGPCNATRSRSRSCNTNTCRWNSWGNWSTCPSRTCTPGATTNCVNNDSCGHRVCNSSCNWGQCEPRISGGCLRRNPNNPNAGEGTNWRCCGSSRWQFCLSDCTWSTQCAICENNSCGC